MFAVRILSVAVSLLVAAGATPGAAEVQRRAIAPHAHAWPRRAAESAIGKRTAVRGRALTPPRHESVRASVQSGAFGPRNDAAVFAKASTSGRGLPVTPATGANRSAQEQKSPPIAGARPVAVAVAPAERPPVEGKLRYGNTCRRVSRAAVLARLNDPHLHHVGCHGFAPAYRHGQLVGVPIVNAKDDNVEGQLGFRHYDFVTSVHGRRIDRPDKSLVFSQILRPGRTWIQADYLLSELQVWCVDLY